MNVDELAPPTGDAFKFEKVGDVVKGTLSHVGTWRARTNKFTGHAEEVMCIVIDTADGPRTIWPVKGKQITRAIGNAVRAAHANAIEVGGTLAVKFIGEEDTGKGQPMKVFVAQYTPPAPSAVTADDLF